MARNPLSVVGCLVFLALAIPAITEAQTVVSPAETSQNQKTPTSPQVVAPQSQGAPRVAGKSNLYCAGYIKYQRFEKSPEIVGSEGEPEQRTFAEGNVVFLNWGTEQGIKEGQQFQIVRPKGDVKGVFREKKGFLGTYVRELGQLQVFKVRQNISIARITFSCEMILLGDLLLPIPYRESPFQRAELEFDRFAEPSGKPIGRLMMARDDREMVTVSDVVYIDLGSEDKIAAGDYLTIYRPLGSGGVTNVDAEEDARGRATGFQSERYRGGGFSSQSQRAKDSTAFVNVPGRYRYRPVTTREVKRHRPPMPRKIVGEMVVIDVQNRTATAIITRVTTEAHTGDWVEIQ
ncbi:MAG TPA: hypothetical protein VGQ39_05750 [Pyrinomonadaceae bacterium]|nr:hypothetical protein [Pyrinomonadaceae bacterium]